MGGLGLIHDVLIESWSSPAADEYPGRGISQHVCQSGHTRMHSEDHVIYSANGIEYKKE